MSDLRDYILSKLQEMVKAPKKKVKPSEPTNADREAHMAHLDQQDAERDSSDVNAEREEMAKHYGQSREDSSIDLRNYILNKASEALLEFDFNKVMNTIHGGDGGFGNRPSNESKPKEPVKSKKPKVKPPAPKPQNSSTDLRTQLMYILADKLDEIIKPDPRTQKTKTPEDWLAERKPKPATEPTSKPPFDVKKLINTLKKPNKPSPKTSGATPYLMRGEQSSTILKDRMVQILFEMKRPGHLQISGDKVRSSAYTQGLPQINKYRVQAGKKPSERSPIANDPKLAQKSKALASVFNQQPLAPGEEAKVKADKAKAAAERPGVEAGLAKFDRDPVVARIRRQNRRRY
jgi:hypothetical protein